MNSILMELDQAGVRVEVDGDNLRLRGTPGAVQSVADMVRERKGEIMEVLSRPPADLPLVNEPDVLTDEQVDRLVELMDHEGVRGLSWVLGSGGQADQYEADRAFSPRDADLAAALDWLLWRRRPAGATRRDQVVALLGAAP